MSMLRLRITGNEDAGRAIASLLGSIEGIEHVEEVADLMPRMDDPDSSSAGLADELGPGVFEIEVETPNASTEAKVRQAVEALAFDLDVLVEFENDDSGHE